jgi:hypothetical protein
MIQDAVEGEVRGTGCGNQMLRGVSLADRHRRKAHGRGPRVQSSASRSIVALSALLMLRVCVPVVVGNVLQQFLGFFD